MDALIAREPVKQGNLRGHVTVTREPGPNARFTMLFVNVKDNSYLDADGFALFGQVVTGMVAVDTLFTPPGTTGFTLTYPDRDRNVMTDPYRGDICTWAYHGSFSRWRRRDASLDERHRLRS